MTDKSCLHCCIVLFLPYTALISKDKKRGKVNTRPSREHPTDHAVFGRFQPKKQQINSTGKRNRTATEETASYGEICPHFHRGNTEPNIAGSYRLCTLLWGECEHRIRLVTVKPRPAFCCSAGRSHAPTFIKPSSIRRTIIEG